MYTVRIYADTYQTDIIKAVVDDVQIHFRFFQNLLKTCIKLLLQVLKQNCLYTVYLKKGDSGRILNCNFQPSPDVGHWSWFHSVIIPRRLVQLNVCFSQFQEKNLFSHRLFECLSKMALKDIFNRRQSTNRRVLKKALLKDSAALMRSFIHATKCMFMTDKTQLYGCGGAPRRSCFQGPVIIYGILGTEST
jgi:hypothetical protein